MFEGQTATGASAKLQLSTTRGVTATQGLLVARLPPQTVVVRCPSLWWAARDNSLRASQRSASRCWRREVSGVREVTAGGERERNSERSTSWYTRLGTRALCCPIGTAPGRRPDRTYGIWKPVAIARRPNGDYRSDRRTRAAVEHESVDASTDEHVDLRTEICRLVAVMRPHALLLKAIE